MPRPPNPAPMIPTRTWRGRSAAVGSASGHGERRRRPERRRLRRPRHGDPPAQQGVEDFLVFERAGDVGGTWWANTYPGCQCDIPSHLYSFSFAPNPDWTRTYPKQPELRDYLRATAEQFGVYDRIRFEHRGHRRAPGTRTPSRWRIETSRGRYTADVLVAAPGPLSEPSIPDLPGPRRLRGHDLPHRDLEPRPRPARPPRRGRRHRRLGDPGRAARSPSRSRTSTSSSARRRGSSPTATGRSPALERALYRRFPPLQRRSAPASTSAASCSSPASSTGRSCMKAGREGRAQAHRRSRSPTPSCARRSRPTTRSAASGSCRPTSGTRRCARERRARHRRHRPRSAPTAIVTADGALHEVDTIIFATGFYVTDIPLANIVTGARRPRRWPRSGTARRRPTAARRSPASRTCSCSSAPTSASATTRSSS